VIAAVIALALLAAGLGAALVWAVHRAGEEGRLALAEGKSRLQLAGAEADAQRALAAARVALAQRSTELTAAADRIRTLEAALSAARRNLADERLEEIHGAPADGLPAAVDGVLEDLATEGARRAAARAGVGAATTSTVSGSGPATDGPRPAWVDALEG
jgi:hypothetical protein